MNRYKLSKYWQYLFSCIFSLVFSLQSFSQVAPAGGTSAPAGQPQGGTTGGNTQGGTQGGQTGSTTQQPTSQQIQEAKDAKAANDKGKAAPANDAKTADADNQGKANQETSSPLSPEEQAKAEFRKKIYGSSIFTDKKFDPIPDLQIATPVNYVVGPDDELNIYLYNYAEATYKVVVNRDGYINLPLAGNIAVGGRTIEEVRKILIDKLSKFKPGLIGTNGSTAQTKLMVTLGDIRAVHVFVTGEVVNPSSYELTSLASAFNALYQAGGPNEIGTFRDVRVVRQGKVISRLDIYDFLTNGKIDGDVRVQDNDNIIVGPYLKRVEITGQVKRPGIYELTPEEKLADAIRYAGGFSDRAYRGRVKLQGSLPKKGE